MRVNICSHHLDGSVTLVEKELMVGSVVEFSVELGFVHPIDASPGSGLPPLDCLAFTACVDDPHGRSKLADILRLAAQKIERGH